MVGKRNVCFPLLAALALFAGVLVQPAYAYLDPGTGSYIIQILIGGLLGGLFAIGVFWKRFVAWVKGVFGGKKSDAGPKPPVPPQNTEGK